MFNIVRSERRVLRSQARIRSWRKDALGATRSKTKSKAKPKKQTKLRPKKETKTHLRSGSVLDDGTAVISLSQTTVGGWRLLVSQIERGAKRKGKELVAALLCSLCSDRAQSQITADEGCQMPGTGARCLIWRGPGTAEGPAPGVCHSASAALEEDFEGSCSH